MKKVVWHGDIEKYIDVVDVKSVEHVTYGCFGGDHSAGQYTNEDGFYVLAKSDEYVLSILMDAHASNESIRFLMAEIEARESHLKKHLDLPIKQAMKGTRLFFTEMIHDEDFIRRSKLLTGETAFMVVFQKEKYLWWLSIGDNSLYLLHPELAELGQIRLNQRVFYQWIGEANALDLEVACYTESTIELRQGISHILMLTDGVLECDGAFYNDPNEIYAVFDRHSNDKAIEQVLKHVQTVKGRDSSTMISWSVVTEQDGLRPTRL